MIMVENQEQALAVERGTQFYANIGGMKWRDAHAIMYYTANREVEITTADGTVYKGKLDETPGYFGGFYRKVWIRIPGRKTRKGIDVAQIVRWQGFKSPSLEEALNAYIYLNSGGATNEQIRESLAVARDM